MAKPKLAKQVFEIRYERGYRYLDRCGEALLIFEDLLPRETGKTWMPEEIVPAGAKLKCPELDVILVFDTARMIVEQEPADVEFDFPRLCNTAYSVISARFDLGTVIRMGCRRFFLSPVDSTEAAAQLSLRLSPIKGFPGLEPQKYHPRSIELTAVFETADEDEGYRVSASPTVNAGAPDVLDQRLLSPPRLLPSGQKEALLAQLQRRKQREKSPVAGVMIDIDYYWTRPVKVELKSFLDRAISETARLADAYAGGK